MSARDHVLLRQLPNTLTLLRLLAVPAFVVSFVVAGGGARNSDPDTLVAGLIFLGASCTDFWDGFLARRMQVMSRFGTFADPLADRFLVTSAALLTSLYDHRFPDWSFVVVAWRDVLTVVGGFVVRRRFTPRVSRIGKLSTALLMLSLICSMLFDHGHRWPVVLFWIGAGLSIVAFVDYVVRFGGLLRGDGDGRTSGGGATT